MKSRFLQGCIFITLAFFALTCRSSEIEKKNLELKAPEIFKAKFETSKGDFEITAERKFSPLAVDRFYQLIKSGYFTDITIYRVVPNFVAQFGTLDTNLDNAWSSHILNDEPVIKSNDTGTVAFARAGKNSRGTQLFINLKNNARLDTVSYGETLGFPAFAYVSKGMDIVNLFYKGYGDEPRQKLDSAISNIPKFIKKNYPNLDYIKSAVIIE
jgi:cyclophilin family peptidyl-prolyl cis-trans isomerase